MRLECDVPHATQEAGAPDECFGEEAPDEGVAAWRAWWAVHGHATMTWLSAVCETLLRGLNMDTASLSAHSHSVSISA